MHAFGTVADAVGEIFWMGESTCLEGTVKFARAVVKVLGAEYLREPTVEDTKVDVNCSDKRFSRYPKFG